MVAYAYTGIAGANNGAFYVDGMLKANNTVTTLAGNNSDVWIGGAPDYGTGRLLPASIAHVAVFTNGLSATQVLALYKASTNPPSILLNMVPTGGGNLILNWPAGLLLQATNLVGPWITNLAAPPLAITPTNSQMYFRMLIN